MFINKTASKTWLIGNTVLLSWYLTISGVTNIIKGDDLLRSYLNLIFSIIIIALTFSGVIEKPIRRFFNSLGNSRAKAFLISTSFLIFVVGTIQVIPALFWPTSNLIRDQYFWLTALEASLSFVLATVWFGYNIYFVRLER